MDKCDVNPSSSHAKKRLQTLNRIRESKIMPRYFDTKHREQILNALEDIQTDVLLGKPIHWNMLHCVIRAMKVDRETAPYSLKFLKELLSFFERYQCDDEKVISKVFRILMVYTTDYPKFSEIHRTVFEDSLIRTHFFGSSFAAISTFFYMPYGAVGGNMDFVWNTAKRGNLGLLKLQLKFGMRMMIPPHTVLLCEKYLYYVPRCLRLFNPAIDETDLKMIEAKEEHRSIYLKLCTNFSSKSRRRLYLVFKVLEIACTMQFYPKYKENFIECYRLLFDSIPEAYVTSVEVETSLEKCLPDTCSGLISEITKDFKRLLPELAEVPEPRSLQHLCRIQVRQSLRQNSKLPHGVSSLPLPRILKKYIMLNDDGDYTIISRHEYDKEFLYARMNFSYLGGSVSRDEVLPVSVLTIPEEDDCMISFIRNL